MSAKLSKKTIAALALVSVIVVAGIFALWTISTYNGLVQEEESIDSQWAQVGNQYQRKVDLIPQLLNATEGYQEFERGTLENVTRLRSQWMQASSAEDQVDTANQLDAALKSIILTYESYPNLQSDELVHSLMFELTGTENRIAVERMRYNDDVRDYNAHIKSFPASMVAGWFGFEERAYYESVNAPPPPS